MSAARFGTVYLLHLQPAYKHARHYLGWTAAESVEARLERHRRGDGARLLRVARDAGCVFVLVRVWENAGRAAERKLKNRKEAPRLCPLCRTAAAAAREEKRA